MKNIIATPYINQTPKYPTGCESVSAVMLLQYLGYSITPEEFIDIYLEKKEFEKKEGILYGPDPNKYFCGSPYDENSFGCYAPVLKRAIEKVVKEDYLVIDETDTDLEELKREYLDQGMPVIFWACIKMREPIVGPSWLLFETEEEFTWISNEHCMLLVGYDDEGYYFQDPYENRGLMYYEKKLVENRHKAQYNMAIGMKRK